MTRTLPEPGDPGRVWLEDLAPCIEHGRTPSSGRWASAWRSRSMRWPTATTASP